MSLAPPLTSQRLHRSMTTAVVLQVTTRTRTKTAADRHSSSHSLFRHCFAQYTAVHRSFAETPQYNAIPLLSFSSVILLVSHSPSHAMASLLSSLSRRGHIEHRLVHCSVSLVEVCRTPHPLITVCFRLLYRCASSSNPCSVSN